MSIEPPLLVTREDGRIRVEFHWGRIKVECDLGKWEVRQGLSDSGSTISILLVPVPKHRKKKR